MFKKIAFGGMFVGVAAIFVAPLSAQEISKKETEQLDFAQGLLSRGLYDMAVGEYQKFISSYPQSVYLPEANLAIGECYFLAQDFPRALEAFVQFKERFPQSEKIPAAILRLGQIYIQQNQFDEALKELTAIDAGAQLKGSILQSFYFYIGKSYQGKNDATTALSYFQKASEVSDGGDLTAYSFQEIAQIHTQSARYSDALAAYTKAISLTTDEKFKGYLIFKTGETHFLSGNFPEAIAQFRVILDQYPSLEIVKDSFSNLLLAYLNQGLYAALLTEFHNGSKFIKEDGAYFDVYFTVVKAYVELKSDDEALALLEKIISFPEMSAQNIRKAMLKKADIFVKENKFKEGLAIVEGALPGSANDADQICFLKGQAYYGLDDFEKATQFFGEIKNNYPQSIYLKAAMLGLAHCLGEKKDFKKSADAFLEYYSKEDNENLKGESLYEAAVMESKADAYEAAIAHAEEYLEKFPQGDFYEQSVLLLGDLYARSNHSEKALPLLDGYLTHVPPPRRSDAVYFLLGYNQQLLGKSDEALNNYAKVSFYKEEPKFYLSALKNSAIIFLAQKNDTQAAVFFDRIITDLDDNNDLDFKTYLWLCSEYINEKKFNDVLRVVGRGEARFPGQYQQEFAFFKAEAYRNLKDSDRAHKFYDVVLFTQGKSPYASAARIGKGLSFVETQKLEEAKKEFQKAIDADADDHTVTIQARFELGNIASIQKNDEEALKFYLLIGTIYEDEQYCPESLWRAAEIFDRQKRAPEAAKLYQAILEKYPNSPAAAKVKEKAPATVK